MPLGQSELLAQQKFPLYFMEDAGGSAGDRILRCPTHAVAVSESVIRTGAVGNTSLEEELDSPAIVGYGDVSTVRKRSHVRGLEEKVPSLARCS